MSLVVVEEKFVDAPTCGITPIQVKKVYEVWGGDDRDGSMEWIEVEEEEYNQTKPDDRRVIYIEM